MARPTKWRKIENIPVIPYFVPSESDVAELAENILKLEISNKYNDIFSPDNFYCKNLCSFYTQCLDRYGVYD